MSGMIFGGIAGTVLAVVIILLIPGDQSFIEGMLLGFSLSAFGTLIGARAER